MKQDFVLQQMHVFGVVIKCSANRLRAGEGKMNFNFFSLGKS